MKNLYCAILSLLLSVSVSGIDIKDTRMLSQPTVSDTHVAFIYAEDLWVANIDGSNPKRLTVDEGIESLPSSRWKTHRLQRTV